jgi:hypothetical protein
LDAALIRQVWHRAAGSCEYCQLPQEFDDRPFEIDHIRSQKQGGPTIASNLALSCFRCNSFKGSDISGIDAVTRKLTPLFNPRRHKWATHFRWEGPYLLGRTPIGRVTVALLNIDDELRVELRESLITTVCFRVPKSRCTAGSPGPVHPDRVERRTADMRNPSNEAQQLGPSKNLAPVLCRKAAPTEAPKLSPEAEARA